MGFKSPGNCDVPQGAEAHHFFLGHFGGTQGDKIADRNPGIAAPNDLPRAGKVELGKLDVFASDIVPNIHLRPVGNRENAEVLAWALFAVEEVPEFGALVFGVPLPKVVAVAEETLFGTGLFLVAPGTSHKTVKLMGLNGF